MAVCSLEFGSFASVLPLLSRDLSHVLVPSVPRGGARESGISRGRSERLEAGVSRAMLGQRTPGTELSVSTISITKR